MRGERSIRAWSPTWKNRTILISRSSWRWTVWSCRPLLPRFGQFRLSSNEPPGDPHMPFHDTPEILPRLGGIVVVQMPVADAIGDSVEPQLRFRVRIPWSRLRRHRLRLRHGAL